MSSGQLQQYCLKWNNHQNNMLRVFTRLLSQQHFTDCILAAEGKNIKCHKVSFFPILSLNMTYLRQLRPFSFQSLLTD